MATINPAQSNLHSFNPAETTSNRRSSSPSSTGGRSPSVSLNQLDAIEAELAKLEQNQAKSAASNNNAGENQPPTPPKVDKKTIRETKLRLNQQLKELAKEPAKALMVNRRKDEISAATDELSKLEEIKDYITSQPLDNVDNINETMADISQRDGDYSLLLDELAELKTAMVLDNIETSSPEDLLDIASTLEPDSPEMQQIQERLADTTTDENLFDTAGLEGDVWAQYSPTFSASNNYYSTAGMVSGMMQSAGVSEAYDVMNQYYGGLGVSA